MTGRELLFDAADEIFGALREGDITPGEAVEAWDAEKRAKLLCARCSYERLSACGDGRGYPACMETVA